MENIKNGAGGGDAQALPGFADELVPAPPCLGEVASTQSAAGTRTEYDRSAVAAEVSAFVA